MAEPPSVGGRSVLRERPGGASEATLIRGGRNFLPKRRLGTPSVHSVTVYVKAVSPKWRRGCPVEVRGTGRRGNRYPESTCTAPETRLGSCMCMIGSNPCDSVQCYGLNWVPTKFMC